MIVCLVKLVLGSEVINTAVYRVQGVVILINVSMIEVLITLHPKPGTQ
jgi:hypothetical protein